MLQKPAADRQTVITILKFFKRKFKGKSQSPKTKKTHLPKPAPKPDFGAKAEKNTILKLFKGTKMKGAKKKKNHPKPAQKPDFGAKADKVRF